jgi:hypothetical protein
MAQVVECLPAKLKPLNSNHSIKKKEKKGKIVVSNECTASLQG